MTYDISEAVKLFERIINELVETPTIKSIVAGKRFRVSRNRKILEGYVGKNFVIALALYYLGGRIEIQGITSIRAVENRFSEILIEAILSNRFLRDIMFWWISRYKTTSKTKRMLKSGGEKMAIHILKEYFRKTVSFKRLNYKSLFLRIEFSENKVVIETSPLFNEIILEYLPEIARLYENDFNDYIREQLRIALKNKISKEQEKSQEQKKEDTQQLQNVQNIQSTTKESTIQESKIEVKQEQQVENNNVVNIKEVKVEEKQDTNVNNISIQTSHTDVKEEVQEIQKTDDIDIRNTEKRREFIEKITSEIKKIREQEKEKRLKSAKKEVKIDFPDPVKYRKEIETVIRFRDNTSLPDIINALEYSLEVIPSPVIERIKEVPVLRYLYSRQNFGKKSREDVFFIVLNLNKMIEWGKARRVARKAKMYLTDDEEVATKEYIINRLVELFQQDEEAYFRIVSIALNKILRFLYDVFTDVGTLNKDVTYDQFLEVVMALPKDSEVRNIVTNIIKNLNFLFVLPKEVIDRSVSADVLARAIGVYSQEETNLTVKSHTVLRCSNCGMYFIGKEETSQNKKEIKVQKCIFCNSSKTKVIFGEGYNFRPNIVSYVRVDDMASGERIYTFAAVAEFIGQILDASRTPIILIPFHSYEKKKASPVEKIIPILVAIADVELIEDEQKLNEAAISGERKLSMYEDKMEKLKILAKSVNSARDDKLLVDLEYTLISYLIALATSTNRKILLKTFDERIVEGFGDIKPSVNMLVVGEPGSGKSTIKDKLSSVFIDKVYGLSMFRYTARQISGYANPQKPRKSVLASMVDKLLIFDEATTARDTEIYSVLREVLESGKLEDGGIINTGFVFIMNDPLNLDKSAIKIARDLKVAQRLATMIQRTYGSFESILSGAFSYMIITPVSHMLTRAFVERMRCFVIVREWGKVYKNVFDLYRKYAENIKQLKMEGKLLTLSEVRGLFYRRILPISIIIVPEELLVEVTKYAEFFSIILRKVSERLQSDEDLRLQDINIETLADFSVERIKNALIILASGIAKLTEYDKAFMLEPYKEYAIILSKEDIELAKYFFITFAPDLLHELAMKQLEDIFKHIEANYDKILTGDYSVVDYDTLRNVAMQAKIKQSSTIEPTKVKEEVKSALSVDKVVTMLHSIIKNIAVSKVAINYKDIINMVVDQDIILSAEEKEKAKKILEVCMLRFRDFNLISMSDTGEVYDVNRSLLQRDFLILHVQEVFRAMKNILDTTRI